MSDRQTFFLGVLRRLHEASRHGQDSLRSECKLESARVTDRYPEVPIVEPSFPECQSLTSPRARYSKEIFPAEWRSVFYPGESTADGNCLFRSISFLCTGSEHLHVELRARVLCELVLHPEYYLQPEMVSVLAPDGSVFAKNVVPNGSDNFRPGLGKTPQGGDGAKSWDIDTARLVFDLDCAQTATLGTWASMWHVYALASVLQSPLLSIYPNYNQSHRPAFNKWVLPRQGVKRTHATVLAVMWTRLGPMPGGGTQWSPNHFVPCFRFQSYSVQDIQLQIPTMPCGNQPSVFRDSTAQPTTVDSTSPAMLQQDAFCSHSEVDPALSCTDEAFLCSKAESHCLEGGVLNTSTPFPPEATSLHSDKKPHTVMKTSPLKLKSGKRKPKRKSAPSKKASCGATCSSQPPAILTIPARTHTLPDISTICSLAGSNQPKRPKLVAETTQSNPRIFTILSCERTQENLMRLHPLPQGQTTLKFGRSARHPLGPKLWSQEKPAIPRNVQPKEAQRIPPPSVTDIFCHGTFRLKPPPKLSSSKQSHIVTREHHAQSAHALDRVTCGMLQQELEKPEITQLDPSLQPSAEPILVPAIGETSSQNSLAITESRGECTRHLQSPTLGPKLWSQEKPAIPRNVQPKEAQRIPPPSFTDILCHGTFRLNPPPKLSSSKQSHIVTREYHSQSAHALDRVTCGMLQQELEKPEITQLDPSLQPSAEPIHVPGAAAMGDNEPYFSDIAVSEDDAGYPSSEVDHSQDEMEELHSTTYLSQTLSQNSLATTESGGGCLRPLQSPPIDKNNAIPFPCLPSSWYAKERRLYEANAARTRHRSDHPPDFREGDLISINRACVAGTLEDNVKYLQAEYEKLSHLETSNSTHDHLKALLHVGKFIMENGPIVPTQRVGRVYFKAKGKETSTASSASLYEIFSRHLNVTQVYINSHAYIIQSSAQCKLENVIQTVASTANKQKIVNDQVQERLQSIFQDSLQYLDTHRDRQVVKALMAELTSVKFTSRLQGITSRQGTTSAKRTLRPRLQAYKDLRRTSQIVRNDLTIEQQFRVTARMIDARKAKLIRTVAKGRGRKLKCQQFPELSAVLQYSFGELDLHIGGGGLESHPRLTTGTLYRSSDSATTMKQARELILSIAPPGFTISLSSCFNYTQNYREGSAQAKRHHSGRNVNADICLKRQPRTGVENVVINLHWCTANVNHLADKCQTLSSTIISKDAKAIVPCDISPVQYPGHSWKKRAELPDHSWEQSRTNSVTPMTFLFLETKTQTVSEVDLTTETRTIPITRSGQGVTLIYLSFFEADTTIKCLNEIFFLLSLPALDQHFRHQETGQLKKHLLFIVDNGPAEQPSSALVQMCLARMLNFLRLEKVTQVAFSEYHSKRNHVERVHAEENRVLGRHGPFSSKTVHLCADVGSVEHKDNMEQVAVEVIECLKQASFGKKPLLCYRGIRRDDFLFNDEENLYNFLDLNEEGKLTFGKTYEVNQNSSILNDLHCVWGVDMHFQGSYTSDYLLLQNNLTPERTSWRDKYTTVLYSPLSDVLLDRYEQQPVPDYMRWIKTCELHYMPLQERILLDKGPWDETPGSFLPSRILDLCFTVLPDPPLNILKLLSILGWVRLKEIKQYYDKLQKQAQDTVRSDIEKETWKQHPLYRQYKKGELVAKCHEMKIPVTASVAKHHLVKLISNKNGESEPAKPVLYQGKLVAIPTTLSSISRLTVSKLRAVLKFHGFPTVGSKEQLVLRVFQLRHGETAAMLVKEEREIKDFIRVHEKLILAQRKLSLNFHTYQRRMFSSDASDYHCFEPPPEGIGGVSGLSILFKPLTQYIEAQETQRKERDQRTLLGVSGVVITPEDETEQLQELITEIGTKVKVRWTSDDVGESGWKAGWYNAYVQGYHAETDTLTLEYPSEPGCVYSMELTPAISSGEIKLVRAVF